MIKGFGAGVLTLAFVAVAAVGGDMIDPGLQVAVELAGEGDHDGAAIEFRRLALGQDEPEARGGFYWAAAHEYWKAEEPELAAKMLDKAEDEAPRLAPMAFLLRGETATAAQQRGEAIFYFESVFRNAEREDAVRALAGRRLAALRVRDGRIPAAQEVLRDMPGDLAAEREAIEAYAAGRDKKPGVGGVLGLIPGLGYAYAGDYANGLRSLILNALFIWGMVDTAEDENWGAFAVISFFEITWYSGSIYGGIDASHRYNRRRLEQCTDMINGASRFEPEYPQLPAVAVRFEF